MGSVARPASAQQNAGQPAAPSRASTSAPPSAVSSIMTLSQQVGLQTIMHSLGANLRPLLLMATVLVLSLAGVRSFDSCRSSGTMRSGSIWWPSFLRFNFRVPASRGLIFYCRFWICSKVRLHGCRTRPRQASDTSPSSRLAAELQLLVVDEQAFKRACQRITELLEVPLTVALLLLPLYFLGCNYVPDLTPVKSNLSLSNEQGAACCHLCMPPVFPVEHTAQLSGVWWQR